MVIVLGGGGRESDNMIQAIVSYNETQSFSEQRLL
jgi:hypothetical protein